MFKINGKPIEVTMFPDRTSQVWKLPEELFLLQTINIDWYFNNEGEVMQLVQLVDLFRSQGPRIINLYIDYLPYARQDKDVNNLNTFALGSFAKVLNILELDKVEVLDMHSDKLIRYCKGLGIVNKEPVKLIRKIYNETNSEMIYYPDYGAARRYIGYSLSFDGKTDIPEGKAQKTRNPITGEITGLYLQKDLDVKDKTILMVDDLCDGGKTFTELAKLLYDAGAKEVNLYVTHGIFSKGIKVLEDANIKKIYTKNGLVIPGHYDLPTYIPYDKIFKKGNL